MEKTNDNEEFPTHVNGSKRIDFIMTTAHTIPFVKKIGYTPFYEMYDSDNRGMYCDLDKSIFGSELAEIVDQPSRLIGTNSKKEESINYVKYLDLQFRQHRIYKKSKRMYTNSKMDDINKTNLQKELDKVDELVTNLMIKCEKETCAKKSKVMWSPAIMQSCIVVNYWKLHLKSKKRNINLTAQMEKLKRKLPEETQKTIELNTLSPTAVLERAKQNQQLLFKHHWELREEHMKGKEQELKGDKKNKEAAEARLIRSRENMRKNFMILKQTFGESRSKGISQLEIPDTDNAGKYIRVSEPKIIEQELLKRNIFHFSQARGTPFTSPLFEEKLGYEGTNQTVLNILKGDVPKELVDDRPSIEHILNKLSDGSKLEQIDAEFQFHEFQKSQKKMG